MASLHRLVNTVLLFFGFFLFFIGAVCDEAILVIEIVCIDVLRLGLTSSSPISFIPVPRELQELLLLQHHARNHTPENKDRRREEHVANFCFLLFTV